MQPLSDMASVMHTLRQGIEKGLWTLEDLDNPSMHWQENAKQYRINFPGKIPHPYRNLLRDNDYPAKANLEPEPCGGPGVLPGRPPVSVPGGVGQPFHHHRGERQDAGADGPDHVNAF